ncbi:pseudoazurin [Marinomonas epiphytica]
MLIKMIKMAALLAVFVPSVVFAKDWQIKMLNYGEEGSMVFEPSYIEAQVGDTVTFIPAQSGHNAKSYVVPEGEQAWSSKLNQEYTLSLNQQGVHLYYCPPHLIMGMIGVIKVGEALNQQVIEQKYPRLRSKISLNPARADKILDKL